MRLATKPAVHAVQAVWPPTEYNSTGQANGADKPVPIVGERSKREYVIINRVRGMSDATIGRDEDSLQNPLFSCVH